MPSECALVNKYNIWILFELRLLLTAGGRDVTLTRVDGNGTRSRNNFIFFSFTNPTHQIMAKFFTLLFVVFAVALFGTLGVSATGPKQVFVASANHSTLPISP
jgi:hypothetical protein